jgi:hypothetical protein
MMEKDAESARSGHISHFQRVLHQGVLNDDIIEHNYKGSGTESDPFLVTWIENDPVNPMNYPQALKWTITMLVAIATLAVAFVSSAYSGGITQVLKQFQVAQIIGTLGISLFVLGFAIGPLLWAPLSGEYTSDGVDACSLTVYRIVWTPVSLLWHIYDAYDLQCRCSGLPEHTDFNHTEVLWWHFWLVAIDQCWRCYRGHVSRFSTRSCNQYFCCSSVPGSGYRPHW